MTDTRDRTALVTGAARGIGYATAVRFLDEGWRVALLDIDSAGVDAAARRLDRPGSVLAVTADVSDPQAVSQAVQRVVEHFGRLDALVNNAGIAFF
jgi:NAD(P)-dependent dehydrogenase (short-subunit alcohol dehydrogenase family)